MANIQDTSCGRTSLGHSPQTRVRTSGASSKASAASQTKPYLFLRLRSCLLYTSYVKSQLSRGRKLNQVVTKITLKKATNASGIAFSQAVFAFERMLTAEERTAVAGVSETVKAYAANLTPASLIDDEPLVDPETGEIIEPLK